MKLRMPMSALALTCALAALALSPAYAQNEAFRVVTVPWVPTDPTIPHDGVAGELHSLQAVASACADGPIEYRWDVDGDGTYEGDFIRAADRRWLHALHTYQTDQPRLFYARVEARCGQTTASAEFRLRIHVDPPLGIRVNRAISNGLWYGHITLRHIHGFRRAYFTGEANYLADTAALAQAMMNRGHRAGVDPAVSPYVEDVQWMLHEVANGLAVGPDPALQAGEDPDFNGNGTLLRFAGLENYVGGGCLEALASYGDLGYVPPPEAGLPAHLQGISLGELVQDAAEYFAWSQSEIPFGDGLAGGWSYDPNAADIDTSQVGWPAVGLFAARVSGGAEIADWVTDRLYQAVLFNDASRGGDPTLRGGYGYRGFADYGVNAARSGAMLNALGFATDRDADDPQVQATVDFIAGNWGRNFLGEHGGVDIGNYYGMYQIAKGMRSFAPPFEIIGDGIDWYRTYAQFLVDTQSGAGRWVNDTRWTLNRVMTHALALLVLIPTLFEPPPTAVATATPLDIGPGDTVTFAHDGSHALDAAAPLVLWRWDFISYPDGLDADDDGRLDGPDDIAPEDLDGDGRVSGDEIRWEIETDDPNLRPQWTFDADLLAGEERLFAVRLQVEDARGQTDDDPESVVVRVTIANHPPIAQAHPDADADYLAPPGRTIRLDATASTDPDTDEPPAFGFPADTLTAYTWDLDGDGTFETEGPTADFAVPPEWRDGETRIARLRVCDDGTWIGQTDADCGGDCSLCHTTDFRLRVVIGPVPVIDPAIVLNEGETLVLNGGASYHHAGRDFDLSWACDAGLPLIAGADDRTVTADATALDGPAAGAVFNCTLTATGDGLTDVATFTVTVNNRAPTGSATIDGAPGEGATVQLRAIAEDAPADRAGLRYSFDCDGDGAFEIEASPTPFANCRLDDGDYAPQIRVDDGDGGVTDLAAPPFTVPNLPPVALPIICPPEVRDGVEIVWPIEATDPGRGAVTCTLAAPVPEAAAIDACLLRWTPTYEQALADAIDFTVTVTEPDGLVVQLRWSCDALVRDDDRDTLPDTWEDENGTDSTLDDCADDLDRDGVSNCDEFSGGTHPGVFDGPTPPVLRDPIRGEVVTTATPDLTVANATTPRGRPLTYEYAIFEPGAEDPIATSPTVPETPDTTLWTTPDALLEENATYEWTARAHDGLVAGPSDERETFALDALPEPPTAPTIRRPEPGDAVGDDPLPVEINNATDPDPEARLTYECEFAADLDFDPPLATGTERQGQPTTTVALEGTLPEDTTGYIRCRAIDDTGLASDWSDPVDIRINRSNALPTAPEIIDPAPDALIAPLADPHPLTLTTGRSTDADGDPLTYRIEVSADPAFPADATFTSEDLVPDEAGEVSFAPPPFATGQTWHWRARAHDGFGAGPSSLAQFVLESPPEPDLGLDAELPDADLPDLPDAASDARPDDLPPDTGLGGDNISGTGCACDATDDPPGLPLLALALIALARTRRRRA